MLLPIGDENYDRRTIPYINYLLIAANVFVFVFLQGFGYNAHFTFSYAIIPAEILTGKDLVTGSEMIVDPLTGNPIELPGLQPTNIPVWFTLITGMFMHGGIGHLAGNMLYLWICRDNVEDRLGHFRYLVFYLF